MCGRRMEEENSHWRKTKTRRIAEELKQGELTEGVATGQSSCEAEVAVTINITQRWDPTRMPQDLGRHSAVILGSFNRVSNISHVSEEISVPRLMILLGLCTLQSPVRSNKALGCLSVCENLLGKPQYRETGVWGQKRLYG